MEDKILKQIIAHAERAFPNEACGFIIDNGAGHSVIECENVAPPKDENNPGPTQTFLIEPMVYAQYAKRITAVYHSHPNRSPEPSEADKASSQRSGLPFVIVGYPSEEIYTYYPDSKSQLPYEGRHFVYGVMDCLNLVSDYYRQEFGILIGDNDRKKWDWWQDPANSNALIGGFEKKGFVKVPEPKEGDVVVMQLQAQCPNHVAIYLGGSIILHHTSLKNLSRSEIYNHHWRHNTVCFLRHESRMQDEEN